MAVASKMSFWKVLTLVAAVLVAPGFGAETVKVEQSSTSSSVDNLVQNALARGCAAHYDITCLKLDALKTLDRFSTPTTLDLAPGITVQRAINATSGGNSSESELAVEHALASSPGPESQRQLDTALVNRFARFLDAHSLQIRLLELAPVAAIKAMLTGDSATARRRPNNGLFPPLLGAGMVLGGSTLTVGLTALAAVAGKALMLSMLSLVLSALSGIGGGNGGGGHHAQKQTTYEIISKPVYTHGHTHSAELHHEPSGPAAYGIYGRSKDSPDSVVGSTGASGVGGAVGVSSGVGSGATSGAGYLSTFPRSLQESALLAQQHRGKKSGEEEEKTAVSYDGLLIRNLNEAHHSYRQSNDGGRASYATPQDLVPSETDYAASEDTASLSTATVSAPARHKYTTDTISRSFQLDQTDEEAAATGPPHGPYVVASPRGLPLPHLFVGEAEGGGPEPALRAAHSEAGITRSSPQSDVFRGLGVRPLVYRAYGETLLPVTSSRE